MKPATVMNGPTAAVPKREPSDAALGAASAPAAVNGSAVTEPAEPVYSPAALDRLIQLASSGDVPTVRIIYPV